MKRKGSESKITKRRKLQNRFHRINVQNPQLLIQPLPLPPPARIEPYYEYEYEGWGIAYGFVSAINPISDVVIEIEFECIDRFWFQISSGGRDPEAFFKLYKVVPASRVVVRSRFAQIPPPPEAAGPLSLPAAPTLGGTGLPNQITTAHIQEGHWYKLWLGSVLHQLPVTPADPVTDGHTPQAVTFTPEGLQFGPPRLRHLTAIVDVNEEEGARLESFFSLHNMVEPEVAYDNPALAFVGMLNVGQGSCCALYDNTGRPFLYYDFGRAIATAERPSTAPQAACLSGTPTIILSHLDKDHYSMAFDVPGAFGVPWIIPETPSGLLGPTTANFVNRIAHKRMWPHANKAFEEYDWGFLLKGTSEQSGAKGKNNAGLVALVRVKNDTNAPPVGQRKALDPEGRRPEIFPDERYVVLTADVVCAYIDSIRYGDLNDKVVAITAPHHGTHEELNWFHLPTPAPVTNGLPPTVGFSYGVRNDDGTNSYSHPTGDAIAFFNVRGFHHRINNMTSRAGVNVMAAHPYAHEANAVLFSRLQGPPADIAANLLATADMLTYTNQVAVVVQARQNSSAAYDAYLAGQNNNGTILQINAAAQVAFNRAPGVDLPTRLAFNVVYNQAAGTRVATRNKYYTFWQGLWNTVQLAANQAQTNALAAVQSAVQTPHPQLTRCNGANLNLPDPGNNVLNIEQTPYNTPVVGLIAFNEAINILGAAPASTVTHNNHRLRTGDSITIANNAVNAGYRGQTVQITVVTANTYTIPIGAAGQNEIGILASGYRVAREGAFVEAINIVGGNPISTVAHTNHGLKTGDAIITPNNAVNLAFQNRNVQITVVNANSYTIPINANGQNENNINISGFRLAGSFAETVTIAGGNPNSTITHNNHRLQNGNNITFANTNAVPPQFRGQTIAIAVVNGNSYTVAINAAGVNGNNVPVSGVRGGNGRLITPTRWDFNRTISLVGGNNTATVTCNNHYLETGDTITIDPTGTAVNAVYRNQVVVITKTGANTFTIPIGNIGQNEINIPARGNIPTRWYFDRKIKITGAVGTATVTCRKHNLQTGETITIDPTSAAINAVYRNQTVVIARINNNTFRIPIGNNGQNENNLDAVGVNPVRIRNGIARLASSQLQATLALADYNSLIAETRLSNCDAGHTTFRTLARHNP